MALPPYYMEIMLGGGMACVNAIWCIGESPLDAWIFLQKS